MGEEVPKTVGEYSILRPLAEGAMSQVYVGTTGGNVFYAVKVLRKTVARLLPSASRFVREIDHMNILQYRMVEQSDGIVASDFLEVKPVSRGVLEGLSNRELVELFLKVADAVNVAHGRGILHANIKPSNLLIRRSSGKVMPIVSDFGMTYIYKEEHFKDAYFESVFPYMAPERIEDLLAGGEMAALTPAADVYSLTCALCEVLTRRRPFSGAGDAKALMKLKRRRTYEMVSTNRPSRTLDVKRMTELLHRAMAVELDERPKTMKEFSDELRACLL